MSRLAVVVSAVVLGDVFSTIVLLSALQAVAAIALKANSSIQRSAVLCCRDNPLEQRAKPDHEE